VVYLTDCKLFAATVSSLLCGDATQFLAMSTADSDYSDSSGVARNFRQGCRVNLQHSFLSIPAQLPYQVCPTIKKRHDMNRLYDYEQLHVMGTGLSK